MSKKKDKKRQVIEEALEHGGYASQGMYIEARECLVHVARDWIQGQMMESSLQDGHTTREIMKSNLVMPQILPERDNPEKNIYIVSLKDGHVNGIVEIFAEFLPDIVKTLNGILNYRLMEDAIEETGKEEVQGQDNPRIRTNLRSNPRGLSWG